MGCRPKLRFLTREKAQYLKQIVINITQGCCRFLIFFIAVGPVFDCLIDKTRQSEHVYEENVYTRISAIWRMIATGIELIVCLLVMADCIVIDSVSYEDAALNRTFLHLFKLHPLILRGLLYLVVSGIETTWVPTKFDAEKNGAFILKAALDIGRKALIIPAIIQIIMACLRYRIKIIDMKTGDMIEDRIKQRVSKFWILTRYYEIEDYKQNNQVQTISQRIGRALLFIPLLMAMVLGGFSIFIKSQVLERLHMNISNISVLNSMAESNITQINESQKALLSAEIILPYVSHTLLSLLFFAFIVVCISRSKFVRLHNALKVLIFYNGLSFVIPIKTIRLYGILYSYDLSMESFLCFMSLVPFSFAFPILFYLFSHYPYKHIGDVVNSIKDIRQLISNFGNSTKLHKFLNTLMIIFGLSGLFLLLLSLFLPWVTIEFYPSKELKQISKAFEGAHNSILNILNSISSSNVIKFQTSLDKFKPLFKSPILTFVYKFKLDIHIILFLLPCFLFGMVCCAIGFWRRHSLEGVSSHFVLSAIAFTFFVSNIAVWFLIFFFKSLFYAVLRLAPLIDPRVNEEVGLKMMKIAFTFSSIAAMILWLKTTGSFIVSLVRWIIKKSCTKRNRVNMYAKQENKMAILSSNDEISTMDRAVGVNVITLPENEHSAKDCKIEMKPFKIKSKLSSPTTWVMSLFPAIVSSIIIIYIIIERPEMFTANPELTGQLRSLITETKERSNGISVNRMKRDISLAGKTIQIFKRSAPDNITEFISGLNMTFLGDKSFDIGGFIYALNILMPFLSTILVFLGFILTSLPCLKLKHKKKIAGTFVCWLLRLIVASLSFSQSIMGLIKIIFARVPFFRLNLEEGPAVPLITAVNIVLLLSWIELRISKCKPLL